MKKKLLFILGVLVFATFIVRVYAEQSVAITHVTGEDEEDFLGYSDDMYKLDNGLTYKIHYELHDREDGYCFYATNNTNNISDNYIDCTENIGPDYFAGTFNSSNLDNHVYYLGYVLESDVTSANCPQFLNFAEDNKKYYVEGCGELNVVNTTTVTIENPYNRQNAISIKSYQLKEKYFNYYNEGEATVTFEGNYLIDDLVEGTDYTAVVYYSQSDAGNNISASVIVSLIGDAYDKYYISGTNNIETTGTIKPYVIKESEITSNDDNTISIMVNGFALVEGRDYTVEYSEENYMITATVSGMGNFDSTEVQKTFQKIPQLDPNTFVQELIDQVLAEEIVIDTTEDDYRLNNSLNYKSYVYEILDDRVRSDNSNNWINMGSCTKTKCIVDFTRYDAENGDYYSVNNVEVPFRTIGFIIDDLIDANVGDILSINFTYIDEEGNQQPVVLKRIYNLYQSERYSEIVDGNKIKVLKQGIFPVSIVLEYNDETFEKEVYVFSEVNEIIMEALNKTSIFYANRSRYPYDSSLISVAAHTFVDEITNSIVDYRISPEITCNQENCEEILEGNFDFNIIIGTKSYPVKKNNIVVVPFGISFDEPNRYPALDIDLGEPYQLEYTLYSASAEWKSSNPEVATVSNTGLITPVAEGATIISAEIENGYFESVIVRVKPTAGTFKTMLTNKLNELLDGRTTVDAKAVSTISKSFLSDYINDVVYEQLGKDIEDGNIYLSVDINEEYDTAYVTLGYRYDELPLPNGDTEDIYYCATHEDDNDEDYYNGFMCSPDKVALTIVYEDQKEGFDNTLITKAQALLNKVDFEEKHYSYVNDYLSDQITYIDDWDKSVRSIGKHSDINKIIENDDGFIFEFYPRMGGLAFSYGDGWISRDGIAYAAPTFLDDAGDEYSMMGLTEAIGIPGHPETDEAELAAVRKVVTDIVDTSKYDVEVGKAEEELVEIEVGEDNQDKYYYIHISDKNNEDNMLYIYAVLVTDYEENSQEEPIEVTYDNIANQIYTGQAITPFVNVYGNGTLLMLGTDYSLRYENNVNVGTAKVYVTSLNGKFEEFSIDFEIVADVVKRTVTFTDGFDNIIDTVEVDDGQPVTKPSDPVKGTLLFSCWKYNNNCYNFSSLVTSDITIEAYWNFNFYVAANVNDAAIFTYSGNDYPDHIGSAGAYHENEIVGIDQRGINGYELKEWHLGSVDGPIVGNDSSADYYIAEGGHIKIKQTLETSGLQFYGIYEKTKVGVSFVTNGGTPIETKYVYPGERVAKPGLHDSTLNGYILGKWYTDSALTHEFNFSTPIDEDLTLYASWNVYLSEVRGTINKPVAGFTAPTSIISAEPSEYAFVVNYWYLTTDGTPHIEGDATFVKDKEYEVRFSTVFSAGYGVDENTKFYINNELTSKYGDFGDRQIRWVATDPSQVTAFNIAGIVAPSDGNAARIDNINLNTEGLNANSIFWTEESTGQELNSSDKFVAKKRYILHVLFNTTYGYVLADEFNEDAILGAPEFLKAEFIDNFDAYEMQIYFEAKGSPAITTAPVVQVVKGNDNSVLVSWNEVENATSYEVYRSTKKDSGFTKIATVHTNHYTNTGLTYGTTYYYKVKALNEISNKTSSVVSGKTVPNKVENLHVTSIGSTNIKVGYDKVNVTGYELYYGTSTSKMTKITITSNSTITYNKTGLKSNTTYYFKVRAYKLVGKTKIFGAYSDTLTVKTAPAAPTITVSNKDYKSLNVKINSVSGASKYKLEVSTDNKTFSLVDELTSAVTYTHTGLTEGTTYYYRVRACNDAEVCGSYSSVVSKKAIPNAPTLTVTRSVDNKVLVKVNEQEGVTGYKVYRSTNKTKNYKQIGTITEGLEYTDSLTYGTTYYYKVVAYNAKSTSSYSSIVSIKVLPEKVNNFTYESAGSTNIKLSYDKVNVTGYEIYYGTSTKKMKSKINITSSNTVTYNKTKLKSNTTYYFKIRAYKKVGRKKIYGPYTSILTVKTAPAAPKVSLSIKEYNEMNINISSASGATNYVVEKSLDGTEYTSVEELPNYGTLTQSGLEIGKTYYYRVKACNAKGDCSGWTKVSKKQTTKVPTFTLSTASKKVTVTLTNVNEADGYEIYRSIYSNKKFSLVKSFTKEDELLEFVNSTTKGKKYYYKVRSYKVVDDTKVYSNYSSVKNIKSK